MISYLEQLKAKCKAQGIWLHQAFMIAKIDPTTYQRTTQNKTSLRFQTAKKVSDAIDILHALDVADRTVKSQTKKNTRRLRLVPKTGK